MNIASMLLRILAILGAVAAAVMFFILGNQKEELQGRLDEAETSLQQTQGQLSTVRNEREELQEQVETLSDQIEESQARNNALETQLTRVRQELAQASQIISTREEEAEDLRSEASRIRRELLEERNRIAELQQSLDEDGSDELRQRARELERQLLETERRLESIEEADPAEVAQQERKEERRQTIRGQVTEVGPQSAFVLLDIGAAEGVRENSPVMIRRGARFIGRAHVTEVHDDVSVARVAPGADSPRAGDVAVTLN